MKTQQVVFTLINQAPKMFLFVGEFVGFNSWILSPFNLCQLLRPKTKSWWWFGDI